MTYITQIIDRSCIHICNGICTIISFMITKQSRKYFQLPKCFLRLIRDYLTTPAIHEVNEFITREKERQCIQGNKLSYMYIIINININDNYEYKKIYSNIYLKATFYIKICKCKINLCRTVLKN